MTLTYEESYIPFPSTSTNTNTRAHNKRTKMTNNNTAIGREWTVVPTTKTKTQEKEMEKSFSLMNEFMREWQWEPETVDLMDMAKVARDRRKGVYKEYELVKSPVEDVVVLAESVVADKNMNADWLDEWVDLGGNESKKSEAVKKSYSEAARVG